MTSALGFVSRNYKSLYPPNPPKEPNALRFGILGAAKIAPVALINPALSHPDVVVSGIAARDPIRAQEFAKKHGIPRVFKDYQELLDDPFIDVVYNPLPNGLHYEWTMKALKAGKHVLLEKPATNTSEEAAKIFALAKKNNLVLLEAFHYRFHPAIQTVRSIIESGAIGKVKGVEAELATSDFAAPPGDIRRNFSLGGGALMDMGGYVINASRYLVGSNPTDVLHIQLNAFPEDKRVDRSMRAVLEFPNDATAAIYADLGMPKHLGIIPRMPVLSILVDGDLGSVYLSNFIAPSLYHYITVKTKGTGKKSAKTQTVKAYTFSHLDTSLKGEAWWSTYRYMLEALVDKIRGRTPQTWVSEEDTLANMKTIEMVYENSGLGIRPPSNYVSE